MTSNQVGSLMISAALATATEIASLSDLVEVPTNLNLLIRGVCHYGTLFLFFFRIFSKRPAILDDLAGFG